MSKPDLAKLNKDAAELMAAIHGDLGTLRTAVVSAQRHWLEFEALAGLSRELIAKDPETSQNGGEARYRADFEMKVRKAGLRHFTSKELLYLGDSNGDEDSRAYHRNSLPPRELWPNMIAVARVADETRERAGFPIRISSLFRSAEYNALVGGVRNSTHRKGLAADLVAIGGTPEEVLRILHELRNEGFFNGGVGAYNTFNHADVRGTKADWDRRT